MIMLINLRDFYPWYTSDELVEVPDVVAEVMIEARRLEAAQRRRVYRNKAHYSLDAGDGIEAEAEACYINMTPHEIFEHELLRCHVCQALNSLPEVQGRRVEAHFLLGQSQTDIARAEGVAISSVCESIRRGVVSMQIYLDNLR
jgi:RNA polymerase sigma-70 factor (ECF subfamily)